MDSYRRTNRSLWDAWADINARSAFYDVQGFKGGASSLKPIELAELGDVAGKHLLHLQCHFGLDTLSWARRGARVTGVDFSQRAVSKARELASELDIPARFLCCDVLELERALEDRFDVVFASYGVLCWIPDVARWARVAAHFLRPGGTFYMVEFHPLIDALDDDGRTFRYGYFERDEPERFEESGNYADPAADFRHPSYQWSHGLGEVVTALLDAGLAIERLHEFPYSSYRCPPFTEEVGPDRHRIPGVPDAPLMFSVRARKASP